MAVYVLIVPTTGSGKSLTDPVRPDFGSLSKTLDARGWGQASSAWAQDGRQAVWVRCDAEEAAALVAEVGAEIVGETKPVDAAKGDTLKNVYRERIAAMEAAKVADVAPVVEGGR